jgi:hypothetical protein
MAKIRLGAKHGKNSSWQEYARVLDNGDEFTTSGAMEGVKNPSPNDYGRLSQEWRKSFGGADYAVFSYATPIAWRTAGRWVIPADGYSTTTTAHQNKIRTAVGSFTEYTDSL